MPCFYIAVFTHWTFHRTTCLILLDRDQTDMSSAFGMATDLLNDLRQVTEQAALEICSYKVGIWSLLPFSILSARIMLSL